MARALCLNHGFVQASFADPIRQFVARILGCTVQDMEHIKELPHERLCGHSPRYAMQTLGTEWGRNIIGPDFWTQHGLRQGLLAAYQKPGVVFSDVRFENEAQAIRDAGGWIVHIRRPGVSINSGHASEAGINVYGVDQCIVNDGSIEKLTANVLGLARAMGVGTKR